MVASPICRWPTTGVGQAWALVRVTAVMISVSSARATDYYVDPGTPGVYATVQAAVDAVAGQSEFNRANIFITPGIYHETVTVSKPYVSLIGEGNSPGATRITFART